MPDVLKIKVCGMREPGNIRELVSCKPDLMGFIFYPGSKRYVRNPDPAVFRAISPGILKVGVYVNESAGKIKQMVAALGLDLVQLHGDETPDICGDLAESGIPVIKAFRVSDQVDNALLRSYADSCEYFLFDTSGPGFGGTGEKFDWLVLGKYELSKPYFLSGGIGPDDLPAILDLDQQVMAGIDINSRFEKEPGLKDISKISEFIQSIRRNRK
jgi:phosphoribosylanthranilate isomerase